MRRRSLPHESLGDEFCPHRIGNVHAMTPNGRMHLFGSAHSRDDSGDLRSAKRICHRRGRKINPVPFRDVGDPRSTRDELRRCFDIVVPHSCGGPRGAEKTHINDVRWNARKKLGS